MMVFLWKSGHFTIERETEFIFIGLPTWHYCDDIMGAIAYQITNLAIVYWTVYSSADQRKNQSSASLAFVRGIHRWPANSPHKGPVTRKMFTFDDVIMGRLDIKMPFYQHKMMVLLLKSKDKLNLFYRLSDLVWLKFSQISTKYWILY